MMKTINGIKYTTRVESSATLIEIPKEGQTPLPESQELINQRSYQMSERNGVNAYIIPTDKERVYLNFIAQKVSVSDQQLNEIIQPEFEYFLDAEEPTIGLFTLADGIIFRCVSADSVPMSKEDYTYFIMMNGMVKTIPNYKTLEVMLAERGQNLLSVRVLEQQQCDELPKDTTPISDKTSAWNEDYADMTTIERLRELENNAKEASEIAEAAKESAEEQIEAVKAQAAASAAAQAAAEAQAAAAQAASEAAIAEANAASAEAGIGE
jgi:hypothetical protein